MGEKNTSKLGIIILILLILILMVGIGYLYLQNLELTNRQEQGDTELKTMQSKIQELENKVSDTTNTNIIEDKQVQQIEQNTVQNNIQVSSTDTSYVGNYKSNEGENTAILKSEAGDFYLKLDDKNVKINLNQKRNDGSLLIYDNMDNTDRLQVYLYPIGINLNMPVNEGDTEANYKPTDNTKVRLLFNGTSQELLSEVFYKVN